MTDQLKPATHSMPFKAEVICLTECLLQGVQQHYTPSSPPSLLQAKRKVSDSQMTSDEVAEDG